jgi:DNA-directed RNA polymerase subunit M/transcription elongation factor TFIIS
MQIQVFSTYLKLAQEGKVEFLSCPMHKEEEAVFQLMHSEENDKIVLQCLACGYKNTAGQQLYENLIQRIKRAINDNS